MEVKKSPKADLEKGKTMGILMGMIVGLAVLFVGFEWSDREITIANRHHRRPKSVLLERSILMAAVRIFTFQLVQQGFTQHSISLAVNKDDALFALFLVLFHHFTKLIQLVIQYFAVAHAAGWEAILAGRF